MEAFALSLPIWMLLIRRPVAFIFFYVFQGAFVIVNSIYYTYFHVYLHFSTIFQLQSEGFQILSALPHFLTFRHILIFIDAPFLAIVIFQKIKSSPIYIIPKIKLILSLCLISISILFCLEYANSRYQENLFRLLSNPTPNSRGSYFGEETLVKRYGLLINMIVGLVRNLNEKDALRRLSPPSSAIESQGIVGPHPNILILQVESLDANIIDLKINGRYVMPFLNSFSSKTIHFQNTLSYHGAGASADADFSILNSLQPLIDNCTYKLRSYNYPNSIIRPLKKAGYTTIGLHGLPGYYFNRGPAFYSMGFDDYFDLNRSSLPINQWGASDKNFLGFLESILDTLQRPWFAYAITLTSHTPFQYYQGCITGLKFKELPNNIIHDYIESMAYVDSTLSFFIPRFIQKNPDAFIFIFGDHSPGDFHSSTFNSSVYACNHREVEFVPFLIYYKKISPAIQFEIASFLDIGPTVLDLAGISFKIHTSGSSLVRSSLLPDKIPFHDGFLSRSELADTISHTQAFYLRKSNVHAN
jgi:phosphoglycerol transferase MdoB-like AlkP superfamily enzyme